MYKIKMNQIQKDTCLESLDFVFHAMENKDSLILKKMSSLLKKDISSNYLDIFEKYRKENIKINKANLNLLLDLKK